MAESPGRAPLPLHRRGFGGEPGLFFFIQPGGQRVIHALVVCIEPGNLRAAELLNKHRGGIDRHKGQRFKGEPVAVLVGTGRDTFKLVLNADADKVGFIDAGLIGDGHAGLEHNAVVRPHALRALMHG